MYSQNFAFSIELWFREKGHRRELVFWVVQKHTFWILLAPRDLARKKGHAKPRTSHARSEEKTQIRKNPKRISRHPIFVGGGSEHPNPSVWSTFCGVSSFESNVCSTMRCFWKTSEVTGNLEGRVFFNRFYHRESPLESILTVSSQDKAHHKRWDLQTWWDLIRGEALRPLLSMFLRLKS